MAPAALLMVTALDEDTVDYVPNYDDSLTQPGVLPAAFPNLLVNGTSGIAVGMATNMAPHNLVEVIGAARHLIDHPDCSLDDLMRFVPGPDLPGGGRIVGLEGIRDAYLTGRGKFRTRATARVEKITPRRMGIVVTELPVPHRPREGHRAGQDARAVQEAPGHLRRQGPHRPQERAASRLRGQERLQPRRRPRAALQAHADGGLLRHQQRGPRRRPAADPRPQGPAAHLRRLPGRRRAPPHRVPPRQAQGPPAPRRGAAHRHRRHRRGDPADPGQRRRRRRRRPGSSRCSTSPTPRPTTSSSSSCAGSRSSPGSSSRPSATSCSGSSRSSRRSSATRSCCGAPSPASSPTSRRPTARRAAPCCSSPPGARPPSPPRSRSPTTRAGCCSPRPACSPAPPATSPSRRRARAPSTTPSSGPCGPRREASSVSSPPAGG